MLNFFLWSISILSVLSMTINHICDIYYLHPNLMRINQFLMYTVAVISVTSICIYRENEIIFNISILALVISLLKSLLYYRVYVRIKAEAENQGSDGEDKEENDENKED